MRWMIKMNDYKEHYLLTQYPSISNSMSRELLRNFNF